MNTQPNYNQPPNQGFQNPQPRSRIDPSQIPNPVRTHSQETVTFYTKIEGATRASPIPPPVSSNYIAVDNGNASPRFMRSTVYTVPNSNDLRSQSHIPFGVIIQPLAQPEHPETEVPVVNCGPEGPIRCGRCRAYISSLAKWVDGGKQWACNICSMLNAVPDYYFCPLDPATNRRSDISQRPELRCGSVDFLATPDIYKERTPIPKTVVFAIDVSQPSILSGMVNIAIDAIVKQLRVLFERGDQNRVGFITFDRTIHFWNLDPNYSQPQMNIVSDIMDPFVPVPENIFFSNCSEESQVEKVIEFLGSIPTFFQNSPIPSSCFGSSLTAACMSLKEIGGQVIIFQSTMPSCGLGTLQKRDDMNLIGSPKEKTLYLPTTVHKCYPNIIAECFHDKISVDTFVFSHGFTDTATLGSVSKATGGQLYYYSNFQPERDGYKFLHELGRCISRPSGYEGVMRVRTSSGLSPHEYFGNFTEKMGNLEFCGIDCDKSVVVTIQHDEKIDDKSEPSIQCALLYTTSSGERRIRVHNLALNCSSVMGAIFRGADLDSITNVVARICLSKAKDSQLNAVRSYPIGICSDILSSYRKYCAVKQAAQQLILPDSLKLFPLYTLGLIKNLVFKKGSNFNVDERVYLMHMLNSLGLDSACSLINPKMYALHNLPEECAHYDENGKVKFPEVKRLKQSELQADGAFLFEDGLSMYFWLGPNVDSQFLMDVFGVDSLSQVHPQSLSQLLQPKGNPLSDRIHNLIGNLRTKRQHYQTISIIKSGEPQMDQKFSALLIEDKGDSLSYEDILVHIHAQIQERLSNLNLESISNQLMFGDK